jgi:glucose-1-phosphate adenylyltransferase
MSFSVGYGQSVLGIILGGGAGTRLYPLTKKRAKPAVPLGANYRLIDIPVSNCINSNINKIYVLTQFNSASLNRHLSRAYSSNMGGYKNEGFVEVLAAQQSPENPNWFQVETLSFYLLCYQSFWQTDPESSGVIEKVK